MSGRQRRIWHSRSAPLAPAVDCPLDGMVRAHSCAPLHPWANTEDKQQEPKQPSKAISQRTATARNGSSSPHPRRHATLTDCLADSELPPPSRGVVVQGVHRSPELGFRRVDHLRETRRWRSSGKHTFRSWGRATQLCLESWPRLQLTTRPPSSLVVRRVFAGVTQQCWLLLTNQRPSDLRFSTVDSAAP